MYKIEEENYTPQQDIIDRYFGSSRQRNQIVQKINMLPDTQLRQLGMKILTIKEEHRKDQEIIVLRHMFARYPFFKQLSADNDEETVNQCLKRMQIEQFNQQQLVYERGSIGTKCYIILVGKVYIYGVDNSKSQDLSNVVQTKSRRHASSVDYSRESQLFTTNKQIFAKIKHLCKINEYGIGRTFGESAFNDSNVRSHSIICWTDCTFAVLTKYDYAESKLLAEKKKFSKNIRGLKSNPHFKGFSKKLLNNLMFIFVPIEYTYRSIVYHQHDQDSDNLYIIKSGEFILYKYAEVQKNTNNSAETGRLDQPFKPKLKQQIAIIQQGQMFGEYEAFNQIPREHTVECNSDSGSVITISLKQLSIKLQQSNELHLLNHLRQICLLKWNWHTELLQHINNTQIANKPKVKPQEIQQSQMTPMQSKKVESIEKQTQQEMEIPKVTTSPFLTNYEQIQQPQQQHSIDIPIPIMNNSQNPNRLPTIDYSNQMITSPRKIERLTTPQRYSSMIQQKIQIISRLHNVKQLDQSKIAGLSQHVVYVNKPSSLRQNPQKWPILATLYLNDVDGQTQRHSHRAHSIQSEYNNKEKHQRQSKASKIFMLERILQNQQKPSTKKKKRALTLSFRQYVESQQQEQSGTQELSYS